MKHPNILLTFIALVSLLNMAKAQDTIFKRDGAVIAAKILEISSTEIKYKKFTFLDGPNYVENKSDVKAIKYSNGLLEQFDAPAPAPTAPSPSVQVKTLPPPVDNGGDYYSKTESENNQSYNKLETRGIYYIYNNQRLKERQMQDLLLKTKDKEIIGLVQSSREAHTLKYIGFGAIPFGIGAIYFLSRSVNIYGNINNGKLAASGLCLVGAIACPIASGIFAQKRKSYNRQAVKLYNERF